MYLNSSQTMDMRIVNFCKRGYKMMHAGLLKYDEQCESCTIIDILDRKRMLAMRLSGSLIILNRSHIFSKHNSKQKFLI